MKPKDLLTKREYEVAELLAWGQTKKEVADRLFISYYTVDNHTKSIFEKAEVSTVNELSAWWFCNQFDIPKDKSPLNRSAIALLLLLSLLPREMMTSFNTARRVNRGFRATERTATRTLHRAAARGRTFRFRENNECDYNFTTV